MDLLYHYTTNFAFLSILQTKELWAHDVRFSNDRREITYALGLMTRAIEEIRSEDGFEEQMSQVIELMRDPFDPFQMRGWDERVSVVSFSEVGNVLSQWRAYAPLDGFSLGFSASHLRSLFKDAGFKFGRVEYSFSQAVRRLRRGVRALLRSWNANNSLPFEDRVAALEAFAQRAAPLIKHESFDEEREWRAFKISPPFEAASFKSGPGGIVPYIRVPISSSGDVIESLREVIVGPAADQHATAKIIAQCLRQYGYDAYIGYQRETGVRISVSGTPYTQKR